MGDFIGLLHRFWVFGESENNEINQIFCIRMEKQSLEIARKK